MSVPKHLLPSGALSTLLIVGPEPLPWVLALIIAAVVVTAIFVVIVRVVGRENWVNNAAELIDQILPHRSINPPSDHGRKKNTKRDDHS